MKYIYYTCNCVWCGKTNHYCYVDYNTTKCYICKVKTNHKYIGKIGCWDWA